ncbi:MAG: 5-formyltetrahydrofolate cyclo-ligase [Rhodobacteraceae bacterium]|nr:5-formyltetrahydrofolate cyclo-ligase [Paracoccaceae bacterium]
MTGDSKALARNSKALLRDQMRARRAQLHDSLGTSAALSVAATLMTAIAPGTIVAGYWPMASELDIRPALSSLDRRDVKILLPVVVGAGQPLLFRRWRPGEPLESGLHHTMQPGAHALDGAPTMVLVPLLAFDRRGFRLGYGGGYYDRTLTALRAGGEITAWGVAFSGQEVDRIPNDPHDARLDGVITEFGRVQFSTETG